MLLWGWALTSPSRHGKKVICFISQRPTLIHTNRRNLIGLLVAPKEGLRLVFVWTSNLSADPRATCVERNPGSADTSSVPLQSHISCRGTLNAMTNQPNTGPILFPLQFERRSSPALVLAFRWNVGVSCKHTAPFPSTIFSEGGDETISEPVLSSICSKLEFFLRFGSVMVCDMEWKEVKLRENIFVIYIETVKVTSLYVNKFFLETDRIFYMFRAQFFPLNVVIARE
jgi:hypothetical protein